MIFVGKYHQCRFSASRVYHQCTGVYRDLCGDIISAFRECTVELCSALGEHYALCGGYHQCVWGGGGSVH